MFIFNVILATVLNVCYNSPIPSWDMYCAGIKTVCVIRDTPHFHLQVLRFGLHCSDTVSQLSVNFCNSVGVQCRF